MPKTEEGKLEGCVVQKGTKSRVTVVVVVVASGHRFYEDARWGLQRLTPQMLRPPKTRTAST